MECYLFSGMTFTCFLAIRKVLLPNMGQTGTKYYRSVEQLSCFTPTSDDISTHKFMFGLV